MKKLLFLAGLVMAAALCSCVGNGGNNSGGKTTDASKTKLEINGKYVEVDTFTANHYPKYIIEDALAREEFVSKLTRPTDASSFGQKKAEAVKRAFNANVEEQGTVTIIYYEKGLEIIKDGQSWFYDGIEYSDICGVREVAAAESVLHPGLWEPIYIDYLITNDWECEYIYKGNYPGRECFYIRKRKQSELNISEYKEWIISQKKY